MSRTANSAKNLTTGIIGQILIVILGFVSRSVFIKTLGPQYLGLNGLFSNIISMLSLTELGIGTAMVYNMYKPIAQNDERHINLLMKFYKTAYRFIGTIVLAAGLVLLPFLPNMIKNPPTFINIYFIFSLYLLQSVSSYFFFAYKSSLLHANQKSYIITGTKCYFTIATNIVQIAVLFIFKNYVLYLLLVIAFNIALNYTVARKSDRMYAFTRQKTDEKISKEEMKTILKDCYALSLYKINGVVLDATDNIILSKYIGLVVVGLYSNYTLLTRTLKTFLKLFTQSFTASVGNLHATTDTDADIEKELLIFWTLNMMTSFLYGVSAIGIFVVANPFISIWIGGDYLLSQVFVLIIALELYFWGIQSCTSVFRQAMGLFQQAKYRPFIGAAINVALSLALVKPMGITGVILATVIASVLTYSWFDPMIVFKHGFKRAPGQYYIKNLLYLAVMAAAGAIAYLCAGLIPFRGILYVLIIGMLSVMIPAIMFYCIFRGTREFRYLQNMVKSMLSPVLKKLRNRNKN